MANTADGGNCWWKMGCEGAVNSDDALTGRAALASANPSRLKVDPRSGYAVARSMK
jgi:hypothetical protein